MVEPYDLEGPFDLTWIAVLQARLDKTPAQNAKMLSNQYCKLTDEKISELYWSGQKAQAEHGNPATGADHICEYTASRATVLKHEPECETDLKKGEFKKVGETYRKIREAHNQR